MRLPISEALGWTLIHSLWEGGIIAAALAALLAATRSPRARYAAGCFASLAMLVSFAVTLMSFFPDHSAGAGVSVGAALPLWSARVTTGPGGGAFFHFEALIPWLAPAWVVGVCLFHLRYCAAWLSSRRMRRRGVCHAPDSWQRVFARLAMEMRVSRPVALLESLLAETPVVLGHLRPVVLVPLGFLSGLPADQVEAVLLHELAHIRRSDYLMNVCQRLVEGLLFYHPATWWIAGVVRAERENCCDDMVVALRGDAHGYAVALTALERNRLKQRWPEGEEAMAATGGNLMKRINRLLYPKNQSGIWAPALTAVVLIAATAVTVTAWQANSTSSPVSQVEGTKSDQAWRKWLNEDVVYIISDQEKAAFESLTSDEERQHFVDQFWDRRNPDPGSAENEFKKEHYRRIAYANLHYASGVAGWKTDRGRIYIRFGPPDEIESFPSGNSQQRPASGGGGLVATYPYEDWRYAHFEGIGSLTIEFVRLPGSSDFRMTLDPAAKEIKP